MLMELLIATHNTHKIEEIQNIIGPDHTVKSLADYDLYDEIIEDGNTFEENALIKAKYCFEKTGIPSLGDDSGMVVEALGGRPGIYSARYAGNHDFDKNIDKVLREMDGEKNRRACFTTVLCFYNGKEYYFHGEMWGKILNTKTGEHGFGYDPVFVPEGENITYAEMSLEDKNKISHRKKAIENFLDYNRIFKIW
ncbi:MAG: RdgB/HAM1 family non-canonical purine NTP pyrophosphatase [Bergeyella sp.]|nr:RdgB/HAM1 family non-canonical purine NTP pyrophosphatase [Bergeyella sp.]